MSIKSLLSVELVVAIIAGTIVGFMPGSWGWTAKITFIILLLIYAWGVFWILSSVKWAKSPNKISNDDSKNTTQATKSPQAKTQESKWYSFNPKYVILGIVVIVFCFVPVVSMPYEVIAQKQVEEEYTALEPYTVQEEVKEPYDSWETYYDWSGYDDRSKVFYPKRETVRVTRIRTVTKEVTKYREVTKTRFVTRPVVETQTQRVSILRYLLR